ncbi:hypothetical protein A8L51_18450 [Pantoea stewartii]|nr:hypothetical protein [Pantoea stewartii]
MPGLGERRHMTECTDESEYSHFLLSVPVAGRQAVRAGQKNVPARWRKQKDIDAAGTDHMRRVNRTRWLLVWHVPSSGTVVG